MAQIERDLSILQINARAILVSSTQPFGSGWILQHFSARVSHIIFPLRQNTVEAAVGAHGQKTSGREAKFSCGRVGVGVSASFGMTLQKRAIKNYHY